MAPELALLLAQMCVAELNLPAKTGECVLQWHKQADLAAQKGRPLEVQVRLYTPAFKRRNGKWLVDGPRQRWVRALTAGADAPAGWPANVPWSNVVDSWLAVQAAAKTFLAGQTLDPCPEAEHYGGRCDDEVGACDPPSACMAQVDCGPDLRQAYWRLVPGCTADTRVIPAGVAAGRQQHLQPDG